MPSWTAPLCALFITRRTHWEQPLICQGLTLSMNCKNTSTSVLFNGPSPGKWDKQGWLKRGQGFLGETLQKLTFCMASGAGSVLGLPTFLTLHHPSWILFPLDDLPSLRDLSQVKNLCHSISISTPPSAGAAAKPRDFTPKNSCCFPCVLNDENPGEKEQRFCTQAGRRSPHSQVFD